MAVDGAGSSSSAGSSFVSDLSHVRNNSEQLAAQVDVSKLVIELIKDLSSRRTEVHRDAANQLRCLAKMNSENRCSIAEHGGIPFLASLLRSSDKMTQEHAITALMNLSLQESNRALIMRAGAIDGIVHVVKWGQSMGARENAAATIQCLSYENANKISIGNTGAIPALVELLHNGTLQGKKDAANALCNLVSHQEGNKRRAVRTGIITVLMDILKDHSTHELDDISLSILANLSVLVDGLVEIGNTEPVTVLINFITCGSTRGQELSAALLCKLCTDDPAFIQAAYHCGVTSPLKAVLRNDTATPRCKRKAKQLLDLLR
jgi:hypothetical protein